MPSLFIVMLDPLFSERVVELARSTVCSRSLVLKSSDVSVVEAYAALLSLLLAFVDVLKTVLDVLVATLAAVELQPAEAVMTNRIAVTVLIVLNHSLFNVNISYRRDDYCDDLILVTIMIERDSKMKKSCALPEISRQSRIKFHQRKLMYLNYNGAINYIGGYLLVDNSTLPPQSIPLPTGPVYKETIDPGDLLPSSQPTSLDSTTALPNQHFFNIIFNLVQRAIKTLPARLKKDAIWLVPLALIWLVIWPLKVMTLLKMPEIISKAISAIIFLTATYNGFVGKAVFVTVLSRTYVPLIKNIGKGQTNDLRIRYTKTVTIIRKAIALNKQGVLHTMLIASGIGLMASNILTRNNRIDKYFVCLLAAGALLDDLSHGGRNPVVKLFITAMRDLPMLIARKSNPSLSQAYVAITGFSGGLVLAFIPGMLNNSYTSPSGFYMGAVFIVAGIVLAIVKGKKPSATSPSGQS